MEEKKKQVVLIFKRKNLLYSISNYAYIVGHPMPDNTENNKHMIIDICEEGNIDRVNRILSTIHALVIEMLHPLTRTEAVEEEVNDDIWEPDEYRIELYVPDKFSRTTIHLLRNLIHEFMVYRVLYDWLSMLYPDAANTWALKANEAEEKINQIKNLRIGTLVRPQQPF